MKTLRVISKWKWKKPADTGTYGEWKLQRTSKGLRPQASAGTWPGRPRTGLAGAKKHGLTDVWEKFVTKGVCWGCGGDWGYSGGLKVDIDSSEYTGYRYCYSKPGYRQRTLSCEDARFIHVNFVLLAEVKHFEKVSFSFLLFHASTANGFFSESFAHVFLLCPCLRTKIINPIEYQIHCHQISFSTLTLTTRPVYTNIGHLHNKRQLNKRITSLTLQ